MSNNDVTVVLCAGLNRSGSTWQLNATREILREVQKDSEIYVSWISEYDSANQALIHLVKVHRFTDAVGTRRDVVVSTVRDLRAVAGSLVRMKWSTPDWDSVRAYLDNYVEDSERWKTDSDLITPYEKLIDQPSAVIKELAQTLAVELTQDRVTAVLDMLTNLIPPVGQPTGNLASADKTTFLHAGHIGIRTNAAAMSYLPDQTLLNIEEKYQDWQIEHGYI